MPRVRCVNKEGAGFDRRPFFVLETGLLRFPSGQLLPTILGFSRLPLEQTGLNVHIHMYGQKNNHRDAQA